jgi:hypothetical protein
VGWNLPVATGSTAVETMTAGLRSLGIGPAADRLAAEARMAEARRESAWFFMNGERGGRGLFVDVEGGGATVSARGADGVDAGMDGFG